jgi:hypothetical protein
MLLGNKHFEPFGAAQTRSRHLPPQSAKRQFLLVEIFAEVRRSKPKAQRELQ